MTSYSLDFRASGMAETTGDFTVTLITFTHPDLDNPVRLSSDRSQRITESPLVYGTVSRDDEFLWVPMSVIFPGDDDQSDAEFKLVIDVIDRQILDVVRASSRPAAAKIELVGSTDLDSVEETHNGFKTQSAPYDSSQVTVILGQRHFWSFNWPSRRMTPTTTPGLHR